MKLLRDPLLHFVILGAALFGLYALATGVFSSNQARKVDISGAEIEFLAEGFERQWGREPTTEEVQRLVDGRVREEILYREALAVGLDRNDVVVRRRMVQKMQLLTQDLALMTDPTDEELRAFYDERREEYRVPPRLSFRQVYLNADERGAAVELDAARLLDELRSADSPPERAAELGDPIMLEHEYRRVAPQEVRRVFGDHFASALFELEPGWQGPVLSGYGFHLVFVGERVEGRSPEIGEIRERLLAAYNRFRSETANESFYRNLASRYEVRIDGEVVPGESE